MEGFHFDSCLIVCLIRTDRHGSLDAAMVARGCLGLWLEPLAGGKANNTKFLRCSQLAASMDSSLFSAALFGEMGLNNQARAHATYKYARTELKVLHPPQCCLCPTPPLFYDWTSVFTENRALQIVPRSSGEVRV